MPDAFGVGSGQSAQIAPDFYIAKAATASYTAKATTTTPSVKHDAYSFFLVATLNESGSSRSSSIN
ncbi:hypothetical protein RYA05_04165 [Pseudomonas syringae pv. actinidiae]|nr:hypothetical protein [Pseudomonas syringae pv. actinidiae]